eukprot:Amastigsp_a176418_32.p2 type:complete len:157 gc:universal Amastigsp_a176418_32:1419-1889(+)
MSLHAWKCPGLFWRTSFSRTRGCASSLFLQIVPQPRPSMYLTCSSASSRSTRPMLHERRTSRSFLRCARRRCLRRTCTFGSASPILAVRSRLHSAAALRLRTLIPMLSSSFSARRSTSLPRTRSQGWSSCSSLRVPQRFGSVMPPDAPASARTCST